MVKTNIELRDKNNPYAANHDYITFYFDSKDCIVIEVKNRSTNERMAIYTDLQSLKQVVKHLEFVHGCNTSSTD